MEILTPQTEAQMPLKLQFERWPLSRDDRLLQMFDLQFSLSEENDFSFDVITAPPKLTFVSLVGTEEIQINSAIAHEKILELENSGKVTPLCIWAIDNILGQQINPVLPERPNPKKRLMILTVGKFTNGNGANNLGSHYIYLKEMENGGFSVCSMNYYNTFLLYPSPGWDLVALCAPKELCELDQQPSA